MDEGGGSGFVIAKTFRIIMCALVHCSFVLACRDGNKSVGHGSNGLPFLDGSRGSWVIASDPLTHDDEITAQS